MNANAAEDTKYNPLDDMTDFEIESVAKSIVGQEEIFNTGKLAMDSMITQAASTYADPELLADMKVDEMEALQLLSQVKDLTPVHEVALQMSNSGRLSQMLPPTIMRAAGRALSKFNAWASSLEHKLFGDDSSLKIEARWKPRNYIHRRSFTTPEGDTIDCDLRILPVVIKSGKVVLVPKELSVTKNTTLMYGLENGYFTQYLPEQYDPENAKAYTISIRPADRQPQSTWLFNFVYWRNNFAAVLLDLTKPPVRES